MTIKIIMKNGREIHVDLRQSNIVVECPDHPDHQILSFSPFDGVRWQIDCDMISMISAVIPKALQCSNCGNDGAALICPECADIERG